jgi:hypothetical protein
MSGSRYAARKEWLAALIKDAIVTADWFGDWTSSSLFEHNRRRQYGQRTVAQQQKQIEALTDTVRKVSERVALSAPAPRIAANEDCGSGGNHLNADLTGDGQPDLTMAGALFTSVVVLPCQHLPLRVRQASTSMAFMPTPSTADNILWEQ